MDQVRAMSRRRTMYTRTVRHGGRNYAATEAMAEIFARRASEVVARGATELVPLLHKNGVDLLLVGPTTLISIVEIVGDRTTVERSDSTSVRLLGRRQSAPEARSAS
ncbi:hypothetical protein [Glaciihabitans sp. UYNi722]|uniref:hypothetical protein n=1 Tax=Glaciihabitans sp. UYNi722 TaxID=3156344 RepID=UPI0033951418